MRNLRTLFACLFFLFLAVGVSADCIWYNPFTYLECLAPATQFVSVPFAAFTSEGLITSISNVRIFTNDPTGQISGDVIQATISVGSGNDIAVGAFDEDPAQLASVPPGFENKQFFIGVRKNKIDTLLQIFGIEKVVQSVAENRQTINSTESIPIGRGWNDLVNTEGKLKKTLYSEMLNPLRAECEARPDDVSFGWKPLSDVCVRRILGICVDNRASINFICYTRSNSFFHKSFGPDSFDVDLGVTMRNADGEITNEVSITETTPQVNLFRNDELVGHMKWFGNLSTWNTSPVGRAVGNFYPARSAGLWFVVIKSEADATRSAITSLIAAKSGFFVEGGNADTTDRLATDARIKFNAINLESNVQGTPFGVTPDSSFFIFDSRTTLNPQLLLTIDAEWLGIVRNVADFDISCGSRVDGTEETTLIGSVTVNETAGVGDSVQISYSSIGGSRSFSQPVGPNESRSFDIPLNFPNPADGSFPVTVSWSGKNKSCNLAYHIVAKPELCGNGELNENENCVTCPQDAGCVGGASCDANPFSATYTQCIAPPPIIIPPVPALDLVLVGYIIAIILGAAGVVLVLKDQGVI